MRGVEIQSDIKLGQKLLYINWGLVALVTILACIGFSCLYSAAGGSLRPWATPQMVRFMMGMCGMLTVALIDIKFWYKMAYPCFALGMLLLIIVEVMGHVGMGAQRWINLGFMKLQPSEVMKIAVVMALARYFHAMAVDDIRRITFLIPAALMVLAPVGLVLLQPDLGTSLMIVMAGLAVFFVAGAPLWMFITGIVGTVASLPVAWHFMHDYQKKRVMTFLDPESDPLGAGYHITQSKIALGSGGMEGKGFLEGTQSRLNFLPEKQTDFIFTLFAEEWGFIGGVVLLVLFALVFLYCGVIALRCRHDFGRLLALGLTVNFSLYVFINIAMVMGLIPVVGAPLPLISYGGTSMLAVMIGFGLIMSCSIYKDSKIPRL